MFLYFHYFVHLYHNTMSQKYLPLNVPSKCLPSVARVAAVVAVVVVVAEARLHRQRTVAQLVYARTVPIGKSTLPDVLRVVVLVSCDSLLRISRNTNRWLNRLGGTSGGHAGPPRGGPHPRALGITRCAPRALRTAARAPHCALLDTRFARSRAFTPVTKVPRRCTGSTTISLRFRLRSFT